MCPAEIAPGLSPEPLQNPSVASRFPDLRGVRWRINLGVLPSPSSLSSSSIDDLRRVTADSRRRYASLRKHLLIDPHVRKFGNDRQDLLIDNPLSQNPDSMWGRFFLNAELEQMVEKDLSRLYPEHGSYFQTPGCQGILRRILLLWCLRHPECGYRQGMHELLAPLLYVLHADIQHLNEIRKLYEDHFVDKFEEHLLHESHDFNFKISSSSSEDYDDFQERSRKHSNLNDLDANVQNIVLLSDLYGAEGELGIVLSERFMEHDAYCMFDALMSGSGGAVAMAAFFSHSPASATQSGSAPVIEASLALYHLLSIVDSPLYTHLAELGVEPQYFALRWLRVLFGREFSLEDLLVIWDEIFSFDNTKSIKAAEHDPGVLNSPRGAFISSMAVSMMLHVRSSLLATEYATTCLQRLLNFPKKVDLKKLIGKAKSLLTLAMEANVPSHPTPVIDPSSHNKQINMKGHHSHILSFDLSSPRTPLPLGVTPERYWEEKWRVAQEEETKKKNSPNQVSSRRKGWTEKIKMRLSRTESDPCPSKRENRGIAHNSSVRRNLLHDLAQQLNADEDAQEIGHAESSSHKDPLSIGSDAAAQDVMVERMSYIDKICSARSTTSEEISPAFSEPASPTENDTETSSSESNISHDIVEVGTQNSCSFDSALDEPPPPISDGEAHNSSFDSATDEPSLPVSGAPDANSYEGSDADNISRETSVAVASNANTSEVSGPNNIPREPLKTISKELKTLSGKFQWFFKLGRHNSGAGTSDRRLQVEDAKTANGGSIQGNKVVGLSGDEAVCNPLTVKADGSDPNLACTLRNLGQTMLENIQVLESAFQPEKNQAGPINNLSKHALVEKGQVTATNALTELRKISNLLREM